ncbi:achaete-scute complex protein T4-like [Episyrphus balteatus]|uniref:achaete-scute complex protein T4-like n=1 Tax=Episyrphus balteatus TaxID=286459 RepID=UPI002485EA69|nr:achaete-scute complex protein T4-like [Episyrphus balteatus]
MATAYNIHHMENKIKYQPIAPAPLTGKRSSNPTTTVLGMNGMNTLSSINDQQYKKKYTYANMPYGEQTLSVARRNARERNRVKQVNTSFAKLRQHIPQAIIADISKGGRGPSKKISKVDTLKIAVEYIRRLHELLEDMNTSDTSSNSSQIGQSSTSGSPPPTLYYDASSPEQFHSPTAAAQYLQQSANSPTFSFHSSMSFESANYENTAPHLTASHNSAEHLQLKFEPYDSYPVQDDTPDDEEILDYISLWQDQ